MFPEPLRLELLHGKHALNHTLQVLLWVTWVLVVPWVSSVPAYVVEMLRISSCCNHSTSQGAQDRFCSIRCGACRWEYVQTPDFLVEEDQAGKNMDSKSQKEHEMSCCFLQDPWLLLLQRNSALFQVALQLSSSDGAKKTSSTPQSQADEGGFLVNMPSVSSFPSLIPSCYL